MGSRLLDSEWGFLCPKVYRGANTSWAQTEKKKLCCAEERALNEWDPMTVKQRVTENSVTPEAPNTALCANWKKWKTNIHTCSLTELVREYTTVTWKHGGLGLLQHRTGAGVSAKAMPQREALQHVMKQLSGCCLTLRLNTRLRITPSNHHTATSNTDLRTLSCC